MPGSKQQGSLSLAAIVALTAIGLCGAYAASTSSHIKNAIQAARMERGLEDGQANNLSDLAVLRSMVNSSKLNSGLYEPAIFPSNYFDINWNMKTNSKIPVAGVETAANIIKLKSGANAQMDINETVNIFEGKKTLAEITASPTANTLEILSLNVRPDSPYYVRSMDVRVKGQVKVAGTSTYKKVESIGRVSLEAPKPHNIKFQIMPPGSSSYTDDFGSASKPWPRGIYKFRVVASGVVYYAKLGVNGIPYDLGKDIQGIKHAANNVHAENIVIGETNGIALGGSGDEKQDVKEENCTIKVDNDPLSSSLPAETILTARIVGVDGGLDESGRDTTQLLSKKLYIAPEFVVQAEIKQGEGQFACRNSCPSLTESETSSTDQSFLSYLDFSYKNAGGDSKQLDRFQLEKSRDLRAKGGKGIVCTNIELVSQNLEERLGPGKPSHLLAAYPAKFQKALDDSMMLKRDFAYLAPECKRELVGIRNNCGCFEEKTLIRMADGRDQLVSSIRPGDMVFNPKNGLNQKVLRVIAGPEKLPLISLKVGGNVIVVTTEHPFLTAKGLVPAAMLNVGDQILSNGRSELLEHIQTETVIEGGKLPEVWNFELEGDSNHDSHYVLANGVMTGDLYLQIQLKGSSAVARSDGSGE